MTDATEGLTQLVRSRQTEWRQLAEPGASGVFVKTLRFDKETRRAPTILLKFEAGATYPAHNHPGGEEVSCRRDSRADVPERKGGTGGAEAGREGADELADSGYRAGGPQEHR